MSDERCPHGFFRRLVGCAACDWRAIADELAAALEYAADELAAGQSGYEPGRWATALSKSRSALARYTSAKGNDSTNR